MDTAEIIRNIEAEITRLEKAKELLNGGTTSGVRRGKAVVPKSTSTAPKRRKISAEGRARIAAAQKARWAKSKTA